ncbi:hypothetical protein ABT56_01245 [Photobacterium aquae]|uniref:Uncharacterized protein n=1 Tax=Photobacterium aquae TaxID=1195763 RepID=A0A0J1HB42_9GAMM|nr:hypothetical protein ABT56_01245 [Photobacterium aquae]
MYTIFSLLKWIVLIYLVKTGRMKPATLTRFKKFTQSLASMLLLHTALGIYAIESVDLIANGRGDGYSLRELYVADIIY